MALTWGEADLADEHPLVAVVELQLDEPPDPVLQVQLHLPALLQYTVGGVRDLQRITRVVRPADAAVDLHVGENLKPHKYRTQWFYIWLIIVFIALRTFGSWYINSNSLADIEF